MASKVFNVGKGRIVEISRNIKAGVRANAAFIVVLLQNAEDDLNIIDHLSLADVLAAIGNTEATFTNYSRLTMGQSELDLLPPPNVVDDKYELTFPSQTFISAGGTTDNSLVKFLLCYADDTIALVDSNIVPLIAFDYVTVTDGSSLLVEFPFDAFNAS